MSLKASNLLVVIALLITSCSAKKQIAQKQEPVTTSYGIWQESECTLKSTKADINLEITDLYFEEKARILLTSNVNLIEDPIINVFGLHNHEFNLIGYNNAYVFEIPTNKIEQARMHLNKLFIQVSYKMVGTDYTKQAIFELKDLPKAFLDISLKCK